MRNRGKAVVSLAEFREGRDENNLAEFPLSVLTDTVPAGLKTLEFEDSVTDWDSGKTITRRVCITGSDKLGLPTPKDEDVLLALIQYTKIVNNFSSPEVHFTKRQIIELLGWQNRGWAYDRLEESLHRWKGVSIHYKSAWRDNAKRQWCDSEALGVIEYVRLTDSRRRPTAPDGDRRSRIIWNKILFDSFAAGYLKKLDYQAYRSLERPAARRAYRFLDKRFHHQPDWEFNLRTFACEKIGLSRSYDTGQLKERLRPALGELERLGFIAPVTYRKQRPKVWQIAISRAERKSPDEVSGGAQPPLVEELVQRGIALATAVGLVAEHPAATVAEKLRYFDWLMAQSDKRVSRNPPGFLLAAIRKDYRPSKDYQRAVGESAPLPRPTRTVSTEQKDEPPMPDPQTQAILEHLAQLSADERAALEQQAAASASRIERDTYHRLAEKRGNLWEEFRRSLLVSYVSRTPTLLSAATRAATE